MEIENPVTGLCRNCQKRPATVLWIGDGWALAYVHGGGAPWCDRCAVEAQIKYAEERQKELPLLYAKLASLP